MRTQQIGRYKIQIKVRKVQKHHLQNTKKGQKIRTQLTAGFFFAKYKKTKKNARLAHSRSCGRGQIGRYKL